MEYRRGQKALKRSVEFIKLWVYSCLDSHKEQGMYKTTSLLDLSHTEARDYLLGFDEPHKALSGIKDFIIAYGKTLSLDEYDEIEENVWVSKSATVAPTAFLGAPCIIGPESEIRHCAFVRGSAFVGKGVVVGNSVELKNVILFDGVQVPHYNYVGDSILGYKAHMGAGSITSNVKSDKSSIVIHLPDGVEIETGLKKMGAILGDYAEIGCNSVLNPGTVISRETNVYPLSSVRGFIPASSIYKGKGNIVKKGER